MNEKFEDVMKEKPKRRFSIFELAKFINYVHFQDKHSDADKDFDSLNYLKKNGINIISRLKMKLGFDIEPHKEDTDEVKFEKLKLLKLICMAEKFGKENLVKIENCYLEKYTYNKIIFRHIKCHLLILLPNHHSPMLKVRTRITPYTRKNLNML